MSTLLEWLAQGDLRTDGAASDVAEVVIRNPDLVSDVVDALHAPDNAVRGHAADALEKVARSLPGHVLPHLQDLIRMAQEDRVPMVRWHIAMMLGHLSGAADCLPDIRQALLAMLSDSSVSVRSWAIASLCIVAERRPEWIEEIAQRIGQLAEDRSAAIRARVRKALIFLTDPRAPMPGGWVKSRSLDPGSTRGRARRA